MDKRITLGGTECDLIGVETVPAVWIDTIVEANNFDGILRMSLGTMTFDGGTLNTVQVAVRVRMHIEAARDILTTLTRLIGDGSVAKKESN